MEAGVYKVAEDEDFKKLKHAIDDDEGWTSAFDKGGIRVFTKESDNSNIKIVKVKCRFTNVEAIDLYDVIHDPDYRKVWDHNMIECVDIGHLNPNNDVSYYAASCPPPIKNRDFVLQRSWLDTGSEQYIINHSVFHEDFPPKRGFVRAISLFTGYLIRQNPGSRGCTLGYVTHSDLQSDLPKWLVNKCTQLFAPKYIRTLEKAALGYREWKISHQPYIKPWHFPEQIMSPKLPISMGVTIEENVVFVETIVEKPTVMSTPNLLDTCPVIVSSPLTSCHRSVSFQDSLREENLPPRKTRLLSCLNFTKQCLGRNHETSLP